MAHEWNHNTHHHPRVLARLPARVGRALDVGCGDGSFAVTLAARADHVDAIDVSEHEVAKARERCADLPNVTVSRADLLSSGLEPGSYDVVTALASLHHMPYAEAVGALKELLAPGGRLVVLDLWTDHGVRDLPWSAASVVYNLALKAVHGPDHMGSPAAHQLMPLPEARRRANELLPGAVVRRHLLWRYTLTWDKPAQPAG